MTTREIASEYRLAQWLQIIQARIADGESITAFCQRRGISRNTYFYWQRKIRKAACDQLALIQPGITDKNMPSFTEVKVAPPPALPDAVRPDQIHIIFNGVEITFDNSYPPEKLAALLRELTRSC